mgnify:CR=1 FL=1|jgi:hypothetical protein
MKITITGHSAGIGKALSGLYPEHIGFSRTNGFDISIPEHRAMILSQSKDSDVFVNNAHDLDHQTMMFEEVFEEWRYDADKTIVNVVSRVIYEDVDKDKLANVLQKVDIQGNYIDYKKKLSAVSNPGNSYNRKCRIINVNPGWVATNKVPESWLIEHGYPYLTALECANYIKWAIEQDLEIGELSFWRNK